MSIARGCILAGGVWAVGLWLLPLESATSPTGALWMRICGVVLGVALTGAGVALARTPQQGAVVPSGASEAPLQLALLLLVGTALRGIGLDADLWYDEIVTLIEFVRLPPAELATTYTSTNNHILFSLLAHGSVAAFGESAWALRLPAAAFGVASLAAVWWMAHEFAPRREARLAAWLVALSYHHVWFSQNARGYTGILLWGWLGTALFLRARRGGPRELWLAYAATLALGMYTHLSAVFVFAAHGMVYLFDEARAWQRRRGAGTAAHSARFDGWPLVGYALGLLLVLQLYAALLPQLFATFGEQSGASSGSAAVIVWKNPLWTLLEIVRGLQLGPASIGVALAGLGVGIAGFVSIARRELVHALLIAVPPVITIAVLIAIGFNLWPRYFLISLAFAAIVGMRGLFASAEAISKLAAAPRFLRRPEALASAAAIAVIALSGATVLQNYRFPKQDYSGARDFVAETRRGDDIVLASGLASYPYASYYAPDWAELSSVEQLDGLQGRHERVWVVYSFSTHLRATEPELFARFERDFETVRSFRGTLGDGDVHVLRTRTAPRPGAAKSGMLLGATTSDRTS